MRINKYLSGCELGSRRKVEQLVLDGKISVNGEVVRDLSCDISKSDIVKYKNSQVSLQQSKVYIMLNKPKCYITSTSDEKDRKIVLDLLKGVKEKVFPIGRLDYNTEGMLLLTNDGDFANKIIHPSSHISKKYLVTTKYLPTSSQLKILRAGALIDGVKLLPSKIEILEKIDDFYQIYVTIFEGKNREIRKMFQSINIKIYSLKRLAIGQLELGNLPVGKYKFLNEKDLNKIFEGEK